MILSGKILSFHDALEFQKYIKTCMIDDERCSLAFVASVSLRRTYLPSRVPSTTIKCYSKGKQDYPLNHGR